MGSLLNNIAVQTALIDIAEAEANKGNTGFSAAIAGFRNAFSNQLESTAGAKFHAAVETLALRCPTKTRRLISCPSERSTSSNAPRRIETEVAALQ